MEGTKIKSEGKIVSVHTMKEYGGSRCIAPLILTSAPGAVEWPTSRTGRFTLETNQNKIEFV